MAMTVAEREALLSKWIMPSSDRPFVKDSYTRISVDM